MSESAPAGDVETGASSGGLPPDPETGKGLLKPVAETTPQERVFALIGGAAVVTAGLAIFASSFASIVVVGGVLSGIMGPYAYYQQTLLTDIRTLQETQQKIEEEVNRLKAENERLSKNINQMADSVDDLEDIESALEEITKTQGQSVETFEKQVEENRKILAGMEDNLQTQVLMNLNSVLAKSDTDGDFTIDPEEIETLVRRMKSIPGVTVNEGRFRAAISGKSITAVMDIIRNLFADDVPESERIFLFNNN